MTDLADLRKDLNRLRDEVRLRVHLGSMEARQEWDALETRWERFSEQAGLEDSADNVGDALELLGDELKRGYKRLKSALRD